jgi:hypothetical protein
LDEPRIENQGVFVDIVPNGDCILVVGPKMMKLRVHSLFLTTVSKPFSAMFAPQWKEGNEIFGRSEPVEVLLPEDNATSMQLICAAIHYQYQEIPDKPTARELLGVAAVADKYDCVQSLRFISESWFRGRNDEASDLILLVAAAYLLRNGKAFREITKTLIFTHNGPYTALSSPEVESVMDWKIFCKYFRKVSGCPAD